DDHNDHVVTGHFAPGFRETPPQTFAKGFRKGFAASGASTPNAGHFLSALRAMQIQKRSATRAGLPLSPVEVIAFWAEHSALGLDAGWRWIRRVQVHLPGDIQSPCGKPVPVKNYPTRP